MPFVGEAFLSPEANLPNYDRERIFLYAQLVAAVVIWLAVVPKLLAPLFDDDAREGRRDNLERRSSKVTVIPVHVLFLSVVLCICSILWILLQSSSINSLLPRTVFQAPLLTREDCQRLLDTAHAAAQRNLEQTAKYTSNEKEPYNATIRALLEDDPKGWHKLRYGGHPTVDLNLLTDPFSDDDRQFLSDLLQARLLPFIARLYGVPETTLRSLDVFMVRYGKSSGAEYGMYFDRRGLSRHTDNHGHVSYTIALNSDFKGGGTNFWDRSQNRTFANLLPNVGDALIYDPSLLHEEVAVEGGERYVLVGYISLDLDAKTGAGLGWPASVLSLTRVIGQTKTALKKREGLLSDINVRSIVRTGLSLLEYAADNLVRHQVVNLVQHHERSAFLLALDRRYQSESVESQKGQWLVPDLHEELTFHQSFPDTDHMVASTEFFGAMQGVPMDLTAEKVLKIIQDTAKYMHTVAVHLPMNSQYHCRNQERICAALAATGGCELNYGYMVNYCAPTCMICHMADYNVRCPPVEDSAPRALKPGDLNRKFERIIRQAPGNRTLTEKDRADLAASQTPEYTVRVLSQPTADTDAPWIVLFDNFLTQEECTSLMDLGNEVGYEESLLFSSSGADEASKSIRTSKTAWCTQGSCRGTEMATRIMSRMSRVLDIPLEHSEDIQLLQYDPGDFYKRHHDFNLHMKKMRAGPRILTFFLYLSSMQDGGGTFFEYLNLTVQPVVGRAVLWANVLDQDPMERDERTWHEALPVKSGRKMAANCWYRMYDFLNARDRGCLHAA